MTAPVCIHAGFSKTGTTTLQRHLFAGHSEIHYLGKPYPSQELKEEIHRLLMQESTIYDPAPLEKLLAAERERCADSSRKLMMLSEEMLVSYSKVRDRGLVARRLHKVFGPARILVTIRSQSSLLKTAYLSRGRMLVDVPRRYEGRFVSIDDWLEVSFRRSERSYIGHADFYRTIDYYSRCFGRDNILVLPLEGFTADKEAHIGRLAEFLGIGAAEALELVAKHHEHKEMDQAQLDYERIKTRFLPISRVPVLSGLLTPYYFLKKIRCKDRPAVVEIPEKWQTRLNDYYRLNNGKLAREFNLPLEAYGYPL